MKIRNGFVSNSSSSSFVCYGAEIDEEGLLKYAKENIKKYSKINIEDLESNEDEDEEQYELYDIIEDVVKNLGLDESWWNSEGDGEIYIGRSYTSLKDDETGKQFRDSVKEKLSKIKRIGKIGHIEETYYL
jgi:hypothetical protein